LAGPNQIGTPGEAKSLLRGAIFQTMSKTFFQGGENIFSGETKPLRPS